MSPEEKDRKIERLEQENEALREKIAELERRLGLDSHNSSKPPLSDGLKKKATIIRTKSLREKGKRPSGGQRNGRKVADWVSDLIGRPVSRQRGWEYLKQMRG